MKRLAAIVFVIAAGTLIFQMCGKKGPNPAKPRAETSEGSEASTSDTGASGLVSEDSQEEEEEDSVAPHVIEDEALVPEMIVTGVAACDDFIERYMACEALTDQAKIAMEQAFREWKKAAQAGSRSTEDLADMCSATTKAQDESMKNFGC